MRRLMLVVLTLLLVGCAVPAKSVAIRGGDTCDHCRRSIQDEKLAAELVTKNGMAYKFRTVHCMAQYMVQEQPTPIGTLFVTDYKTGRMFRAERGNYVATTIDKNTNERDFLAFAGENEATGAAKENATKVLTWEDVLKTGQQDRVGD